MYESKFRSFIKAYSWRLCGSCITFCISYTITHRIVLSSTISITELCIKPMFYWLHERIWQNIQWGKYV